MDDEFNIPDESHLLLYKLAVREDFLNLIFKEYQTNQREASMLARLALHIGYNEMLYSLTVAELMTLKPDNYEAALIYIKNQKNILLENKLDRKSFF